MLQFDGTSRMRGTPFRINENYLANYRTVSFKNTWCYSLCLWHDSLFSIFWCLLGQKQALLCIKLWGVCYNLVHNQTNASSGKMDEKLLQSLKLEKIICINEISCNYSHDKVTSSKLIVNAKQGKSVMISNCKRMPFFLFKRNISFPLRVWTLPDSFTNTLANVSYVQI